MIKLVPFLERRNLKFVLYWGEKKHCVIDELKKKNYLMLNWLLDKPLSSLHSFYRFPKADRVPFYLEKSRSV